MTIEVTETLEDLMDDNDFALIFGHDGRIKGIFMPDGQDENNVPHAILEILKLVGIDIYTTSNTTIH